MHSGFQTPGILRQPQSAAENNGCAAPVLVSMNPTQFLDQIHSTPSVAQSRLFLDQHHFLPPEMRLGHHYHSSSSVYIPAVNFKLGLNEACSINDEYNNKNNCISGEVNGDLLLGSECCEILEARQSSLGMLHCWQNQQDSPNIKPPHSFWEQHLAISEASNENGEIVEMRTARLDAKDRTHFDELEAIYKPLGTTKADQTGPCKDTYAARTAEAKRKRKKKRRANGGGLIAEFFSDLVRRVVDRQECMLWRVAEVLERVEEERAAREEEWRRREVERLGREAEERSREKALARDREAVIVSFLERITGERVGSCSDFEAAEINDATDNRAGHDD